MTLHVKLSGRGNLAQVFNLNISIALKIHQPLIFSRSLESYLQSLLKGQSVSKNQLHCMPEEQQALHIFPYSSSHVGHWWARSLLHGDPVCW